MAKKAESTLPNMLLVLTAIAIVAAAALATLNAVTAEPVAKAQKAKVEKAIRTVMPAFDRLEDQTIDDHICHVGYNAAGECVGAAIESSSDNGFGGKLTLMVGFDNDGSVSGYQILETHETPGLGAKADMWFQQGNKGNIIGRKPSEATLAVSKDGGNVDAITGSTITSRAFLGIVNDASAIYDKIDK